MLNGVDMKSLIRQVIIGIHDTVEFCVLTAAGAE